MAILMIFEMTLSYQIMLPLTLACIVAYFTVKSLDVLTMYDVTATRRRLHESLFRLRSTRMADLVQPTDTVLPLTATMDDALAMFARYSVKYVYVIDDQARYQGVIAVQDVTATLARRPQSLGEPVTSILRTDFLIPITPGISLEEGLERFLAHQGERLPIVQSPDNAVLLGVISKTALLEAYARLYRSSASSITE